MILRWPPKLIGEPLDAYGPELDVPDVAAGDRVRCWAGIGTIEFIGATFNGVQGIHTYCGIRLDNGKSVSAKLDELVPTDEPAPLGGVVPEGALF